jgi:HEPN domain-containing protein
MENKTVKLSNLQCKELDKVIISLVEKYKTEYIFCFGCRNNTKSVISCFVEEAKQSETHYFLLVITTDIARIEHDVQDYINTISEASKITIVVHGLATVTNAILQGSRFFSAVCRYGLQLYSASGLLLNIDYPNLNPATTFTKAQKHFYHRFGMASGFLESASNSYDGSFYSNCMFELHQSVEQACIAVIRVYIAYRADLHNLTRLISLCKCFSDEPADLFPNKSDEDQRLFQLLLKSYSETRYKDGYEIADYDADKLCTKVREFLELIKRLCNKKLQEYRQAAEDAGKEIEDYIPLLPASLFS